MVIAMGGDGYLTMIRKGVMSPALGTWPAEFSSLEGIITSCCHYDMVKRPSSEEILGALKSKDLPGGGVETWHKPLVESSKPVQLCVNGQGIQTRQGGDHSSFGMRVLRVGDLCCVQGLCER